MKYSLILLILFNLIVLSCAQKKEIPLNEHYLPVKGSAWRLALADVTDDGKNELIYGAYDGAVRCIDLSSGKIIWEVSTNSFPFSVAAADVDHDGKAEVFAAAADGGLYAIDSDGTKLWTFRSKLPIFNVAVGDIVRGDDLEITCGGLDRIIYVLSSKGKVIGRSGKVKRHVQRMAVADLDNDGIDEIFAVANRTEAQVWEFENGNFIRKWIKTLKVPDKFINWENPWGNFYVYSIDIADIDDDGTPEIIVGESFKNKHCVMALTASGESIWLSEKRGPFFKKVGKSYYEFYGMSFVRTLDLDKNSPGKEIVMVVGGTIAIFDSKGRKLIEGGSELGFTDICLDGTTAYLGSSPNGDNTIYRINMAGDWVATLDGLERQGVPKKVGENLAELRGPKKYLDQRETNSNSSSSPLLNPTR